MALLLAAVLFVLSFLAGMMLLPQPYWQSSPT